MVVSVELRTLMERSGADATVFFPNPYLTDDQRFQRTGLESLGVMEAVRRNIRGGVVPIRKVRWGSQHVGQ